MRRHATAIMVALIAAAPACSDELGPSGPPTPLGVQWSKTVVDQDDYLEGFVASNHRLYVLSTTELVAYDSDGIALGRVPAPPVTQDPNLIGSGIVRLGDGVGLISYDDHWVRIQGIDKNLELTTGANVPTDLFVLDILLSLGDDEQVMLDIEADPVDGPDDKYYMKLYNIADVTDQNPDVVEQWVGIRTHFYKIDSLVESPVGGVVMCEEITGSLWRIRPGVGLVGKLTFWDVKDDTADFCNLVQTKHGLVATWIGRDGIYGAIFDAEGTKVLWGPNKVANDDHDSINLPGYYQLLGEDTLVGVNGDDFHLILTTIHVSDAGLKFSRQYEVEIRGPQVLDHGMLRVMDDDLYMAYTNSTFSDSTVTLAKLDPLPE